MSATSLNPGDAAPEATARSRSLLRRVDGQPVRVLVVDDEAALAELVVMVFRYEGVTSAGPRTGPPRSAWPGPSAPTSSSST